MAISELPQVAITESRMPSGSSQQSLVTSASNIAALGDTKLVQPSRTTSQIRGSLMQRVKCHLKQPLSSNIFTTLLLLMLTFCTGIQDATTFPDYHCFTSNQTGNTIFLTLAVVLPSLNGQMFVTSNIALALTLFLAGAWLTGQIGHVLSRHHAQKRNDSTEKQRYDTGTEGARQRWFLILCNTIQTTLVLLAALLQHLYSVQLTGKTDLCVIAFLAFAAGSQVVQSRVFSVTEIPTAMATAAWVDLVIDPYLFSGLSGSKGRNKRIAFILALVAGGFVGAALYRCAGSAAALLVSGLGKLAVVVGFVFHDGEAKDGEKSVENV